MDRACAYERRNAEVSIGKVAGGAGREQESSQVMCGQYCYNNNLKVLRTSPLWQGKQVGKMRRTRLISTFK